MPKGTRSVETGSLKKQGCCVVSNNDFLHTAKVNQKKQTLNRALTNALNSLPHSIRIINVDFKTIYANNAFARLAGIHRRHIVGENCWKIFSGPFCHTPECSLRRILGGNSDIQVEVNRLRHDGSSIACALSAYPMHDRHGQTIGIIQSFRDISRRKQLQSQLDEAESRYQAIVELTNEIGESIVMTQDSQGQEGIITFASYQFTRLTHVPNEELIGRVFFDFISPVNRHASLLRHRRKMKGESLPGLYEIDLIRKDKSLVTVELTSAVTQYKGKPANVIFIRDITERKIAEANLIETKAHVSALQKSESMMTEFQALASHQIRTPLTAIKGFASTLLQTDVIWSEEEKTDFIREIENETNRLSLIVNDLLDSSAMKVNRQHHHKCSCSITDMLHELGYGLEQIIAPRHLKLVTARIIPCVKINKDQIIQVIYNLVENAAKYSPPDSTITIAVEKSETGAVISVSDQGAGISKKDQCNIFDSLHHAKMISSGLKKGTGLGLYICNNIVEAHGGRIWLYSKKGKGSTFYFSLLA